MIAVDTNVLVYAHREDSSFHEAAFSCMAGLIGGRTVWAIPRPCLYEFLAVVIRPRVYDPPTPLALALDQVEAWLETPTLVLLSQGEQHWLGLRATIAAGQVTGGRVHDARIASLCLQYDVQQLWSADRDFSRFPDLKVVNPLTR